MAKACNIQVMQTKLNQLLKDTMRSLGKTGPTSKNDAIDIIGKMAGSNAIVKSWAKSKKGAVSEESTLEDMKHEATKDILRKVDTSRIVNGDDRGLWVNRNGKPNFGNPFYTVEPKNKQPGDMKVGDNNVASTLYYRWLKTGEVPEGADTRALEVRRNVIIANLDKVNDYKYLNYIGTARGNQINHVTALIAIAEEKLGKNPNPTKENTPRNTTAKVSTNDAYEVSTKGDKRYSALVAKLPDGRTIEEAYQLDVKGYRSEAEASNLPDVDTTSATPEFDKLPSYTEGQKTMAYAGIGSRGTPVEIQQRMNDVAKYLEGQGYTLRSGNALGADKAFEGAPQPWEKSGEKVTKWSKYKNKIANKEIYKSQDATPQTIAIANEIHESKRPLTSPGKELHARNTMQIFGANLDTPVDFVLAWTPLNDKGEVVTHADQRFYGGKGNPNNTGGTGQAIAYASLKGIPVINMADPKWEKQLMAVLKPEPKVTKATATVADLEAELDAVTSPTLEDAFKNLDVADADVGTDMAEEYLDSKEYLDFEKLVEKHPNYDAYSDVMGRWPGPHEGLPERIVEAYNSLSASVSAKKPAAPVIKEPVVQEVVTKPTKKPAKSSSTGRDYTLQGEHQANEGQIELIDDAVDMINSNEDGIPNNVMVVHGKGGTGKSTTIGRAIEIANDESTGKVVMAGLTFTHAAKDVLIDMSKTMKRGTVGGIGTFAKFLKMFPGQIVVTEIDGIQYTSHASLENKRGAARPSKLTEAAENILDSAYSTENDRLVIVVDEASMMSYRDYEAMLATVAMFRGNIKLILMGDYHQLPPINGRAGHLTEIGYNPYNLSPSSLITLGAGVSGNQKLANIEQAIPVKVLTEQQRQDVNSDVYKVITTASNNVDSELGIPAEDVSEITNDGTVTFVNPNMTSTVYRKLFVEGDPKDSKYISFTNKNAVVANERIRQFMFGKESENEFIAGKDSVILYDNGNTEVGYTNGKQFTVTEVEEVTNTNQTLVNRESILIKFKSGVALNRITLVHKSGQTERLLIPVGILQRLKRIVEGKEHYKPTLLNYKGKPVDASIDIKEVYTHLMMEAVDVVKKGSYAKFSTGGDRALSQEMLEEISQEAPSFVPFNYSYAITTYKSQGQTIQNVLYQPTKPRDRFTHAAEMYTALSRAKKKLYIIGNKDVLDISPRPVTEVLNSGINSFEDLLDTPPLGSEQATETNIQDSGTISNNKPMANTTAKADPIC